jgi:hypothetical protein
MYLNLLENQVEPQLGGKIRAEIKRNGDLTGKTQGTKKFIH